MREGGNEIMKQIKRDTKIQEELLALRSKYNLSREDIASRLGISMMTVYRWENGKAFHKSRFTIRGFEQLKQELEKK